MMNSTTFIMKPLKKSRKERLNMGMTMKDGEAVMGDFYATIFIVGWFTFMIAYTVACWKGK